MLKTGSYTRKEISEFLNNDPSFALLVKETPLEQDPSTERSIQDNFTIEEEYLINSLSGENYFLNSTDDLLLNI